MSLQLDLYNWQSGHVLCFVSKPDIQPVVLEVEADRNAIGQDILDKVCDMIGTVEKDYLGLQVCLAKKEPFWMNLRNRVNGQISGQPPCRLRLRVKYFVQPHLLMQESTRQLFYHQLRQDIIEGKLNVPQNKIAPLASYLLQCDHGNYLESGNLCEAVKFGNIELTDEDVESITEAYKSLNGLTHSRAMYFFIKEASSLPGYGTEVFNGKIEPHGLSPSDNSTNILMRVGPFGLEIVEEKSEEVKRIPFTAVQLATHTGKVIDIDTIQDDGAVCTISFRMSSEKTSNALYRCITEMLAFFTWDTIHSSVMHQYSRDFKGHLLALFRPDFAEFGKQYVFDVQRTWREAYDLARRTLYKRNQRPVEVTTDNLSASPSVKKSKIVTEEERANEVDILKERLSAIQDALTCQVCMDKEINVVFWPCGHQVCCMKCATQCQVSGCPVCRRDITNLQNIYPNITREFVATGNMNTISPNGETTSTSSTPQNLSPRSQSPTPSITPFSTQATLQSDSDQDEVISPM